jgi:hypothetical protein
MILWSQQLITLSRSELHQWLRFPYVSAPVIFGSYRVAKQVPRCSAVSAAALCARWPTAAALLRALVRMP